jgi:hypothetical protein
MQQGHIKKILFLTLFFLKMSSSVWSQGNLPYIDEKTWHFGFSLGLNTLDFGIKPSELNINGEIYDAAVSTLKPGFSVGIITDLRLNRYLNLRFTPTLHFGERQLIYKSSVKDSLTITSALVCIPFHLKYSAERKGNYRPYLLLGGGSYLDFGRNKDNPVLLQPLDFYTEFGVGCDIYFSFFKLCPELKYAIGFNDMLTPISERDAGNITGKEKFSNALSKLTSRMVTLTFNFE